MKTAISYCRKSIVVKDMSEEKSINYQQQAINEYAVQNGIEIIQQYNDIGVSGKNAERPELQKMLNELRTGVKNVDFLLFYSVDRLGRDLESNIVTMLEITKYVETVVSVSEQLASSAEYFKTFFLLQTSHAQTEREQLLLRMYHGRRAKVTNRKSFDGSFLPLGYIKSNLRGSIDKERLVPATEKNTDDYGEIQGLKIVKYIFNSYLLGSSLREIANNLNRYFGPTRRKAKWNHKSVKYILSNPIYVGTLKGTLSNTENYYIEDANVEAIVDPFAFQLINRRLELENTGRQKKSVLRHCPLQKVYPNDSTQIFMNA